MSQPTPEQSFQLALSHHNAGRLREAELLYRQILTIRPNHPDVLHMLGVLAGQSGRLEDAIQLIRQAITAQPNFPQACNNLGHALQMARRFDEAIAAHRQAVALKPDFPQAYFNLGNALKEKNQFEHAAAAYRQAIALHPNYPEALCNLANALRLIGQLDEAIAACRQAIALKPDFTEAHNNLGNALKQTGQLDQAIVAYRQALALKPNHFIAQNNLGNIFLKLDRLDEALALFRQAIALNPNFPAVHNNLANALKQTGQLDEAIASYQQALQLNPHLVDAHDNLLLIQHYHPASTPQTLLTQSQQWRQQHAQLLEQFIQPHLNDLNPNRRLRIGYVSADFADHVSAYFLIPLLSSHNHEHFEIFLYAQVPHPDALSARFKSLADHWRSSVPLNDIQLADTIRQDKIDILVDLKLHTEANRLLAFAMKPAPIQLTWLGYPGTTGLTTIDYRLTDPHLDPPMNNNDTAEKFYTEKSIRLPHTYWCYDPLTNQPDVNPLPCQTTGHITFGCLNNFCKINDQVLTLWSKILHSLPNSRLMLLAPQVQARQHLLGHLSRENISPDRLTFIPRQSRQEYLKTYHQIDIALDTFPYNGHTTSFDAFWMGVPVITLVGPTAVGRAGITLLSNLNLPELIAHTPEQYIQITTNLAQDLPRLTQLRATLRDRMQSSPLMNGPLFTHNIETIYRTIWQTWCKPNNPLPK